MHVCVPARLTFCILCTAQERRWRQCQRALGCSHVRSIVVVVAAAVRVYNNQLVRCAGFSTIRWLQYVLIKTNPTGIANSRWRTRLIVNVNESIKSRDRRVFRSPFLLQKSTPYHKIIYSEWYGMAWRVCISVSRGSPIGFPWLIYIPLLCCSTKCVSVCDVYT